MGFTFKYSNLKEGLVVSLVDFVTIVVASAVISG